MRCRSPLTLFAATCGLCVTAALCANDSSSSGVELRFAGYPGLACADGRYPEGEDYEHVHRLPVVVSVVGADDRIRRTFGCFFDGDARQLQAMATEHDLRFIKLLPATVSLAIPEAECMLPRRGLPGDVFDVQVSPLGAAGHAPAACLLHGATSTALISRGAPSASDADAAAAPVSGALLLRFQRVSFPALECRYHAQAQADVRIRGLLQSPDDLFSCRFRYRIKGEVVGALLRYMSAAYGLALDARAADLPVVTLRPFTCGAGAAYDADVDFLVTGPSGRSAGCKFSPGAQQTD